MQRKKYNNHKEMSMSTTVLLFSSGMDSFIGNWYVKYLLQPDDKLIRLYVNIHSRYSDYELNLLNRWYPKDYFKVLDVCSLRSVERDDAFVPNRNAIIAALAQSYMNADRIFFNATKDDRVFDGSVEFRDNMSKTLSVSMGKPIIVDSVLKEYEKAEWISKYCGENNTRIMQLAEKTYTCYNKDLYEEEVPWFQKTAHGFEESGKILIYGCLECVACYRKLCALTSANIYIPFLDFNLCREYFDKKIDEEQYPVRAKTIKDYFGFMSWFGCD